jgi:hypothetical protein
MVIGTGKVAEAFVVVGHNRPETQTCLLAGLVPSEPVMDRSSSALCQ